MKDEEFGTFVAVLMLIMVVIVIVAVITTANGIAKNDCIHIGYDTGHVRLSNNGDGLVTVCENRQMILFSEIGGEK